MITYKEFQKALTIVNDYKNQIGEHYKQIEKQLNYVHKFSNVTKETDLWDTGLSTRSINALHQLLNVNKIPIYAREKYKVKPLEGKKISDIKNLRNLGNKSVNEIKEMCFYADVKLSK